MASSHGVLRCVTVLLLLASLAHARPDPVPEDASEGAAPQQSVDLYRRARRAVVSVEVTTRAYNLPDLRLPGLTVAGKAAVAEQLEGSGFVVDDQGHVVTTHRMVENAETIHVRLADGSRRAAELVGSDRLFGVAVVRVSGDVPAHALTVAGSSNPNEDAQAGAGAPAWLYWADGAAHDVGAEWLEVRPIRHPVGHYDRYSYAEAVLPSGASGGPLLDPTGRVVGMAAGGVGSTSDPDSAVILFVDGGDLRLALRDILAHGEVQRGLLGIVLPDQGPVVDQLVPGSPAEVAGIREGDRLLTVDDVRIEGLADVSRALLRLRRGTVVDLRLQRDEAIHELSIELGDVELPPPPAAPPVPDCELEIRAAPDDTGALRLRVTVVSVVPDSPLHASGLRPDDRVVEIDRWDALAFLNRHRIRPADLPPTRLVVERGDVRTEIRLDR